MIRKTATIKRRNVKTWRGDSFKGVNHVEDFLRETWWFLFVPVYSRETIIKSNM